MLSVALPQDTGDSSNASTVEVKDGRLRPGASYAVFVDGNQLGTFQTNTNGAGELELDTPRVKAP